MKYLATLVLALLSLAATAQSRADTARTASTLACTSLSGRVSDAFNNPLTGATVILRSSDKSFAANAYSTNSEGRYLITSKKAIPRDAVLLIWAAGYTNVEHPLTNCQPLDISLEPLPGTKFKSDGRIKKTRNTGKIR